MTTERSGLEECRKLAINLAGATGAVLAVMVIVSIATGATQEAHEHFALPEPYAISLLAHADALRVTFALDIAFVALYTGFFAALARYLTLRGRPCVRLALGLIVLTALLDIVEDHHIVTLLDGAEHAVLPSITAIAFQAVLSSTKFSVSYVALVLFGLAIPRDTRLGLVLCLFLTGGTLVAAAIGYGLPPASAHAFDGGRWIGFLAGFALAIAWLRAEGLRARAVPAPSSEAA
jgi:hypothetical protein